MTDYGDYQKLAIDVAKAYLEYTRLAFKLSMAEASSDENSLYSGPQLVHTLKRVEESKTFWKVHFNQSLGGGAPSQVVVFVDKRTGEASVKPV